MKRGECRIDRPPRIAIRLVDIETAPVNPAAPLPAADDVQSGRSRTPRAGLEKIVSFAPLFDRYAMFKVSERVELRFRARESLSGIPIRSRDISFSLRRGTNGVSRELPVKAVKNGVFEVPFAPEGPGEYWVTASIRGAAASVPAVQLGVLGLGRSLPGTVLPALKGHPRARRA